MAPNRHPRPQEYVKFWRDPSLRDLEMLRATYVTYAFSPHAHEGFGIAIVEAGAMEFDYRGATYVAPAGSVVVTHPGEIHTGQAVLDTGWTYRTLLTDSTWLQQAAAELAERPTALPYFETPVIRDVQLNHNLVALHQSLENSPSQLERESRFLWHITRLVRDYASDCPFIKSLGKEHQAVVTVQEYLLTHLATNISLNELATLVNLPPLRLLRTFRKQTGLPPHAYLNHIRVQAAKRLLAAGWTITEAALETGFADQSHLHRHFKKMLGVTPGQYVKGCRRL